LMSAIVEDLARKSGRRPVRPEFATDVAGGCRPWSC
jgi:hypothetical protein